MTRLTNRQLYDYRDIDPLELTLIRATHHIWRLYRQEKRLNGLTVSEEQAFTDAIETMVRVKREYRAFLRLKREGKAAKTREYFAERGKP